MLSSISPVGEAARRQRWSLTVLAYVAASAAGGLLLGAAAGLVGALAAGALSGLIGTSALEAAGPSVRLLLLAMIATGGLLLDRTGRLPTIHRQVDERWLTTYRGWVYGAGFGAQLGFGLVTIIPRSIVLLVAAAAALSTSAWTGALIGVTFGLTRGLGILWGVRARTVGALRRLMAAVERLRRPVDRATLAFQAGVAVVALSAAAL